MKFFIKDFFSKCDQITFTEEILNGKLHFLCSVGVNFENFILGFALCYQFHIMTAFLFSIGMFPYACMVLIPIFCYSNWPKKIFRRAPLLLQPFLPTTATPQENLDCYPSIPSFDSSSAKEAKDKKSKHEFSFNLRKYLSVIFCMLYVTEQTFLPWSHSITQVCIFRTCMYVFTLWIIQIFLATIHNFYLIGLHERSFLTSQFSFIVILTGKIKETSASCKKVSLL